MRALRGEDSKLGVGEIILPVLVGGFGKGDGDFAAQVFGQRAIQRVVDAGDKEAGDHLNLRQIAAVGSELG